MKIQNQKQFVAYIRKSTNIEDKQELSLEAQTNLIKTYAEQEHFNIVRWFEEKKSATSQNWPVFNEMIRSLLEIKDDAFGVVVQKYDNSYKNWLDNELLRGLWNISYLDLDLIVSEQNGFKLGYVIFGLKSLVTKLRKECFAEATKKGLLNQATNGFYPNTPPIGYTSIYKKRPTIERVIDPIIGPQIKAAFIQFTESKSTFPEFITRIKSNPAFDSVSSFSTKRWRSIFQNPFYCGDFIWGGKAYRGIHPALISRKTWLSAIKKLHPKKEL